MFFVLSKFLGFFVVPSNIIVSLGLIGIALLATGRARMGRCMVVASVMLITAVGVLPIGNGLALPLENRFPRWDATQGAPTGIIVLGGGVIKTEISAESRRDCRWQFSQSNNRRSRAGTPLSECTGRVLG